MPRRGSDALIVAGMLRIAEACRFSMLVLAYLDVDREAAAGVTSAFAKDPDAARQRSA